MPRSVPHASPLRTLLLVFASLAVLAVTGSVEPANAQQQPLQATTDTSGVAVPFIGTHEVWCTDRNPSPGICTRHHGSPAIDVGMDVGTEVFATGNGVVIEVEAVCSASSCRGGAGLFVEIEHTDGTFSRYLHLSQPLVAIDDVINVGDLVGLSGHSGSASASSPHLHYDETKPRSTRTPMGPMLGCVNGEVIEYPSALGYDNWNDVPFGTEMTNDGYDCLGGAHVGPQRPDLLRGDGVIAIRPPVLATAQYAELEVTITTAGESTTTVAPAPRSHAKRWIVGEADLLSFRLRVGQAAAWDQWSAPVVFDVSVAALQDERPTCRGLFATSTQGTGGVDVLIGTAAADMLVGAGGNDIICGLGGNDVISGGDGDDWIEGGDGRDDLRGDRGRDHIRGGPSRDTITGGPNRDRVLGGPGADHINGGDSSDVLVGGTGNDTIIGGSGRDRVRAGWGDDVVLGGGGNDHLQGNGNTDQVNGGSGIDSCATAEITHRCE